MPLSFQPSDIGVDPDDYATGQAPIKDPATGLFVPGAGGATVSDADPLDDGAADPGTSVEASRADHVHPASLAPGTAAVTVSDYEPLGSVESEAVWVSRTGVRVNPDGTWR